MAANNYFGFTHGGTQYGATGAAAYQTGQPGYAVTPTPPPAATYTTQRPAPGYETAYQTAPPAGTYAVGAPAAAAPATYDYGYGRAPQQAYDSTKTYYQQPTAAPATYATTETHYQAAKPAFSTTSAYTPATRQVAPVAVKTASYNSAYTTQGTQNSNYTPAYNPSAVQTTTPANTTYSGYDAALYSAATMYVAQQAQTGAGGPAATAGAGVKPTSTWQGYKKGPMTGTGLKPMKAKQPPKPQQLHYCDVCKISCAGPQTYREHLEGQKHKKKESAMKAGAAPVARGVNALRCELCDVTCTGSDAYAAHIRGAKHQKVVKLHTKLGKPIPSTEPVVVGGTKTAAPAASATTAGPVKPGLGAVKGPKKTIIVAPKVNFVASGSLGTVNVPVVAAAPVVPVPEVKVEPKESDSLSDSDIGLNEKDVQPVGQDYIEEMKNDEGKVVSFNCKLCECRFNDPNAKEMHMKGRRHRLQYKKKVNPELVVDVKPSLRQRKLQEEKLRRQQQRDDYWRCRHEERSNMMEEEERMYWEERRRYEEEMDYLDWYHRSGRNPRTILPQPRPFGPPPLMFFPQMAPSMRRPDSSDDRHVLARHAEIYPKEDELAAVQRIVSHTEKALKFTSDFLADAAAVAKPPAAAKLAAAPAAAAAVPTTPAVDGKDAAAKPEGKEESKREDGRDGNLFSFYREKDESQVRVLKGVMRVGVLAKGLLLHGDTEVDLVVLCAEKPSRTLLNKVAENLPRQLAIVAPEDSYKVQRKVEDAAVVVMGISEPHITVTITLTSPVMREQLLTATDAGDALSVSQAQVTKDPPDVLDKQKCLDALAALRHAKWFQARATGLQSCVMVIRILRDLCQRVPTWAPLHSWPMELLVEKVISSGGQPMSPGDSLRRIMEALASGILQPFGPGLLDPCEKDPVDAAGSMLPQQREDITGSAQHALRLIAFRQIHKVLGMDHLPPPKFSRARFNRKRRRDNSTGEGNESEGGDGKKDKKDDVATDKMETEVKNDSAK